MKKLILLSALLATSAFAADHAVQGYVRKDGTYVAPHYQSDPNASRLDNYSTLGNTNPYTGREGTKNLYPAYSEPRRYNAPSSSYSNPYGQQKTCTKDVFGNVSCY